MQATPRAGRGARSCPSTCAGWSTATSPENTTCECGQAMVRIGELTGRLDEVFLRLFHHLAFEKLMRDQVRTALRYPSFVVAVMAAAIVIINLFVIPAFQKGFDGFGAELPLSAIGDARLQVNQLEVQAQALDATLERGTRQIRRLETAIYSPRDARIVQLLVSPGAVVEARDLLIVLEDAVLSP